MTPKVVAKNNAYMHNKTASSLQLILSLVKKYHRNKLAIRENITRSRKAVMFTTKEDAGETEKEGCASYKTYEE